MNELGTFLMACRSELTPREVGLPETGDPRRVAGLCRQEVAQLATISATRGTGPLGINHLDSITGFVKSSGIGHSGP